MGRHTTTISSASARIFCLGTRHFVLYIFLMHSVGSHSGIFTLNIPSRMLPIASIRFTTSAFRVFHLYFNTYWAILLLNGRSAPITDNCVHCATVAFSYETYRNYTRAARCIASQVGTSYLHIVSFKSAMRIQQSHQFVVGWIFFYVFVVSIPYHISPLFSTTCVCCCMWRSNTASSIEKNMSFHSFFGECFAETQ